MKGFDDPIFFCRYFCGIEPFPGLDKNNNPTEETGQIGWLRKSTKPENILSTGNRWGKSLITACKHLWMMMYKKRSNREFNSIREYRTVNIAITIEQAKIVWEEAARLMIMRPQLSWALAKSPTRKPFPLIALSDGQTFTCRSTDQPANLWGPWYDYASYDEAACEKKPETTLPLIKTRLMDHDGMLDYISTPAYTKNWFFKLKEKAKLRPDSNYLQSGSNKENRHLSEEARARFISSMTKDQIAVHMEGEDIEAGGAVFKTADIEWARQPDLKLIEYVRDARYIHMPYIPGHKYIDGWDIATKRDYLVGITFDVTERPVKVVAFERYTKIPWSYVYNRIRARQDNYHSIQFIDVSSIGSHVPEEMLDKADFIIPMDFAKKNIKTDVILAGQRALENHQVIFPQIEPLIEQLTFYEWDDKDLETDAVIAFCLGLFDLQIVTPTAQSSIEDVKIGSDIDSKEMAEEIRGRLR